jgi:hypothetical protein
MFILKQLFKIRFEKSEPVLSYLHPYDIDTDQERFMHPHLNNSKVLNWLMYVNRDEVFDRMEYLIKNLDAGVIRYDEYLKDKIEIK